MRRFILLLCVLPRLLTAAIDFEKSVYPVFEKAGCANCHKENGVASPTRLRFPEQKLSSAELLEFGNSLSVLVDRSNPSNSLLLTKPTARLPHAGGKRIFAGSPEEAALRAWVEHLAASPLPQPGRVPKVAAHGAVGPVLRRLTHAQYNNTIRDLLGDNSRLADQFPPEDFVNGFRNQYQAQNTSPMLAEAYSAAAEKLAGRLFVGGDLRGIVPCKQRSFDDAACRQRFVREFGRRAFRRPLQAAELERYDKLFQIEARKRKQFYDGAQVVVEVMLQSPNFLMRTENGADPSLRPYEIASKLSYFIWNSMPDETLLEAASRGELNHREGVEAQARRLLQSPKARESVNTFVEEWLRFDRLLGAVRDRRIYPQFNLELTTAMMEETRRLVADLVWNKRNFMEFFSAPYSFVNTDLARLYGLPAPKNEYDRMLLPPATGRGGILGQASFLTMTSKPAETSPTARGLFIREQFLCQEVPQPPPGVNANLPTLTKDRPMTQRERLAIHLNNESCASCHSLIDPIGLGLEKFDAIGGYREKLTLTIFPGRGERDEEPKTVELDLDTRGYVAGLQNSNFSSPIELGKILAAEPTCQRCVVKQVFRYMAGRHETLADREVLEKSFEDFRRSGFQFQELIVALAKYSSFADGAFAWRQ
ncbi:MAG: DUF1592 domain-containing protein [Bryobacteraceae bacterium]|nr:DUF1592 domain-containing protein [Bryobacteraceae bacterium]MDW8376923.1 DUF1592 domain-containing protein [Bryobacterales bacterium]